MEAAKALRLDRQRAFVAFAVAVLAFHHLPTIDVLNLGILIDLFAPLAVVGTAAAVLLAERPSRLALAVGLVAALAYVEGHGIHLAANAINGADPVGEAGRRAEFWDERFGHVQWHLGWFGLLLACCLAERDRPGPWPRLRSAVVPVAALGFTLFTSTVEGQTWPLLLAAGAGFGTWAAVARRPLLTQCAAAFGFAAALIGVWAIWQGGVPEFTEVWSI